MAMKFTNAEAREQTGQEQQRPMPREAKEEGILHGQHSVVVILCLHTGDVGAILTKPRYQKKVHLAAIYWIQLKRAGLRDAPPAIYVFFSRSKIAIILSD